MFYMFAFISTSKSIYVINLSLSFSLQIVITNLVLFRHFCQNFSLRVLLSFCLIFCQFELGVAYKSVAYKKAGKLLTDIACGKFVKKQNK